MPLTDLLVVLIVIGVVVYVINTYIPMDAGIKRLISLVGILIAMFYVFYAFGLIHGLRQMKVPHL